MGDGRGALGRSQRSGGLLTCCCGGRAPCRLELVGAGAELELDRAGPQGQRCRVGWTRGGGRAGSALLSERQFLERRARSRAAGARARGLLTLACGRVRRRGLVCHGVSKRGSQKTRLWVVGPRRCDCANCGPVKSHRHELPLRLHRGRASSGTAPGCQIYETRLSLWPLFASTARMRSGSGAAHTAVPIAAVVTAARVRMLPPPDPEGLRAAPSRGPVGRTPQDDGFS